MSVNTLKQKKNFQPNFERQEKHKVERTLQLDKCWKFCGMRMILKRLIVNLAGILGLHPRDLWCDITFDQPYRCTKFA